jgi:ABC-2 type transport system ATP-binding protein
MTLSADAGSPVLRVRDVHKAFRRETGELVKALDAVSLEVSHAELTALVGPDGAGKTTLIRLIAGLMTADSGEVRVLGIDAASDPQQIQSRIAYMPQRFGLYEDLTVQENVDLYADLHGVTSAQRADVYPRLMEMTALGPFTRRLAGRLSGGMKQKLGLACTLIGTPELLVLDEPTVGVDPLSRRELWQIIHQLVQDGLTVLLSTSYLDEAERCAHVVVMHQGKVLAQGAPAEVARLAEGKTFLVRPGQGQKARDIQDRLLDQSDVIDALPEGGQVRVVLRNTVHPAPSPGTPGEGWGGGLLANRSRDDSPLPNPPPEYGERGPERPGESGLAGLECQPTPSRFEDGFMVLLHRSTDPSARPSAGAMTVEKSSGSAVSKQVVVQVRDLVRQFGSFTAVDHISFEVHRGEIFGLLGPNGAGKTTTFRMLCGLLPATGGTLEVAGVDVRHARASARQRIGYVAQKFSLYGQLTVRENLDFFASAYGLSGNRKRQRIDWAMQQFELAALSRLPSGQLPGGYKQRLAMAAALMHEPGILFLDEPTSGADPLARREFWRRITALSRQGVTVIVTTHFMEEAEYCDRAAILDSGKVLAQGTPAEIRAHATPQPGQPPNMEDAFIAIVEAARRTPDSTTRTGGAA